MSIHSFEMTVGDIEISVTIESAHRAAKTFDSPEEEEIDFWFEDLAGNEVEVSDNAYDKIAEECWKRLDKLAENAAADYADYLYDSMKDNYYD